MYDNDYNREFGIGLFVGIFAGMVILSLIVAFVPGNIVKVGQAALETCQKSLPRDQRCILIAIPEEK